MSFLAIIVCSSRSIKRKGAKERKYLYVVLLKPIGYIEFVYGSTRISRCFLYEVSWMCHCGGECHVLGVLVLIGDSTRVGYWMLLHPRAYCLIKWILGSTLGMLIKIAFCFVLEKGSFCSG